MTTLPPVIGLDLSLTSTGVAHPGGRRIVSSTPPKAPGLEPRRGRLVTVATDLGLLVAEAAAAAGTRGALVVIEAPSLGQQRQTGTAERIGLWWLTVDELLGAGHLVVEVAPASRAKYATGKGNSGKTAVASAAAHRYGIDGGFANDDEADAFVLRAMGLDWLGAPLATVPKAHRAALDAVVWPTELELEQLVGRSAIAGTIDAAELLGHLPAVAARRRAGDVVEVPGQLELDGVA